MDLGKLKKAELIEMVEDLELENISLQAEVTILRENGVTKAQDKK